MKFKTKIIEIIKRTFDVRSFRLSRPTQFEYKAGQFMFVTIPTETGDLKKHFTISSSPTEKNFIEFTKKLTGSQYSNTLDSLKIGDILIIDAPYGKFILDNDIKKIGMLSGGIGITPLRSMCKFSTDLHLTYNIILLYGNNNIGEIAFKEELDRLSDENENLNVVYTLNNFSSEWKGYKGYINAEMLKKEIPDYKSRLFYTCGPPAMVAAMKKLLAELSVPKTQIRTENFSGY